MEAAVVAAVVAAIVVAVVVAVVAGVDRLYVSQHAFEWAVDKLLLIQCSDAKLGEPFWLAVPFSY